LKLYTKALFGLTTQLDDYSINTCHISAYV
jgi:hypothetical protein